MNWNQPLRFLPIYQTRVWGGRNLESQFGRSLPDPRLPYGESWEICDRAEAVNEVRGGEAAGKTLHELWTNHRVEVFGEALASHPSVRYPLLMKILDACDDLSIQVHPPAAVAEELGGEPKTEMWYVAQAQPGACFYAGLRAGVTRPQFEAALQDGSVADLMHSIQPSVGDSLFLPSGRLHAIGAGLVIFEVQQNSDTTYRVFDWNRVGLDGQPRELHIGPSLRSMDFEDYEPRLQRAQADGTLATCPFFDVRRGDPASRLLGREGEHLTVAVVEGGLSVNGCPLKKGDFALIPAQMTTAERQITGLSADARWLEVRIPVSTSAGM